MPFIHSLRNPLDTHKVVKVTAGECKRLAASLQRTMSKNLLRLCDRQAASSAKEILQRKGHRSERRKKK